MIRFTIRPVKRIAWLVMSVLLISSLSVLSLQAQESIAVGDTVSGSATGDDVTYSILLESNESIDVSLQSEDFDTLVRVLDADGNEVAYDDDSGEQLNSRLTFSPSSSGTYTILVTSFAGAPEGDFTLDVSRAATDDTSSSSSSEAADSSTDTRADSASANSENALQPGDSRTRRATENVEYTLDLQAGESVLISLTSEDFDTYLRVLNSSGEEIASDDDGGDGLNSRLSLTPTTNETYTVVVTAYSDSTPDGEFTLRIDAADGAADGSSLTYGNSLTLQSPGTVRALVTFEGDADDTVNIYAESEGDDDTRLYLYTPSGEEIAFNDDSGSGLDPYIRRVTLPVSGTYTIELEGYNDEIIVDDVILTLEETEPLTFDDGSVTIRADGITGDEEVIRFEADASQAYQLTVTLPDESTYTTFIEITQDDEEQGYLSLSGTTRATLRFTPESSGTVSVHIEHIDDDTDITLSLEPVE